MLIKTHINNEARMGESSPSSPSVPEYCADVDPAFEEFYAAKKGDKSRGEAMFLVSRLDYCAAVSDLKEMGARLLFIITFGTKNFEDHGMLLKAIDDIHRYDTHCNTDILWRENITFSEKFKTLLSGISSACAMISHVTKEYLRAEELEKANIVIYSMKIVLASFKNAIKNFIAYAITVPSTCYCGIVFTITIT
jgi:hypothetical protein